MSNKLKLVREKATRPRRTVPILTDGEVLEKIEALEHEIGRLDAQRVDDTRLASKPPAAKATEELQRLYESAEDSTLYFVLEGLQNSVYLALVAQHPPRTVDGKPIPADAVTGVNSDTFGLALVRACLVGYRETEDSETLPVDPDDRDWLLGTGDEPGFATNWQLEVMLEVAWALNRKGDAAPLRRRPSPTGTSDVE